MKKHSIFLIMLFIVLNVTCTYVIAEDICYENYTKVKLQRPLKSNSIINLQSKCGFILYSLEDDFIELDRFEELEVVITLGEKDLMDIKDKNNNILYSFSNIDNIYISTIDYIDSIIKVEDDRYRDYLTFNRVGNEIEVINYVSIDHYLYGVVPMEMPSSFPLDALKAQSIASRSFVFANINKHILSGYNLCDSTHCQVYGGYDRETENTVRAIDETKGIVIKYNGEIINATYHSNSGGYTEDCENVWGRSTPYLKAVNDKFSKGAPNTDWKAILSSENIQEKLLNIGVDIGEIKSLSPVDKTETGRVISLKVVGTEGEYLLEKNQIRQVFGYSEIKSNLFNISTVDVSSDSNIDSEYVFVVDGKISEPIKIKTNDIHVINGAEKRILSNRSSYSRFLTNSGIRDIKNDSYMSEKKFVIEGKGYGHGVGMSQWGAKGMAELGYNYEDILNYYYKDIEISTEFK